MSKVIKEELSNKTWLSIEDLEAYIGLTRGVQAKLRVNSPSRGMNISEQITIPIPFYKIGKAVLYKRIEIDQWIENLNKKN